MNIYRFKVTTKVDVIDVIVAALDEETAFQLAEIEMETYFLKIPKIKDISLYEKKRIHSGTGFVIHEPKTCSVKAKRRG